MLLVQLGPAQRRDDARLDFFLGSREVFAYFNNDGGGDAVRNAWTLRAELGV